MTGLKGIIRDLEDLIQINPSMLELDNAFNFILEKFGEDLPHKFKKQLTINLEELRDELSNYFK